MKKIIILLILFNQIIKSLTPTIQFCNTTQNSFHPNNLPIFFTSIPKTGTYLLQKCLILITNKSVIQIYGNYKKDNIENFILRDHCIYDKNIADYIKNKFTCFFIIRDPRDQIISLAYWIYRGGHAYTLDNGQLNIINGQPNIYHWLYHLNIFDLIYKLIFIEENIENALYTSTFQPYLGWIKEPNFLILKFENLVGPNGGGTIEKQIAEINKIVNHLKITISKDKIEAITKDLWGGTKTFREGKIGSWKVHFNDKIKTAFKQKHGQLLIDLGYEKDLNW